MENQLLKAALWYSRRGYSVIPVQQNKKPHFKWKKYQSVRADEKQIRAWWQRWPDANIALVCGKESGLDVVDCDSESGKMALEEFIPDTFITPISETPKGFHFFFKHRAGLANGTRILHDCDLRTTAGYAILPPSRNKSKAYAWIKGLSIAEVEPQPMPERGCLN